MTIAPLLDQLQRDAEDDAAHRLAEARAVAARLRRAGAARLAHRREDALAAASRALAHEHELRAAEVALQAARETLVARARFVSRVLGACARRALPLAGHPGFAKVVAAELAAALACLPDEPLLLRCHPSVAATLEGALAGTGRTARIELDPALPPGFVAGTADGRVVVDATIVRRLALARDRLAIDLVRRVGENVA